MKIPKARRIRRKEMAIEEPPRVERLLALILLELSDNTGQQQRAETLRRAGFQNREIADLLSTSPDVIGQVLYRAKLTNKKQGRVKRKKGKHSDK